MLGVHVVLGTHEGIQSSRGHRSEVDAQGERRRDIYTPMA
jgi:hypothetical protein